MQKDHNLTAAQGLLALHHSPSSMLEDDNNPNLSGMDGFYVQKSSTVHAHSSTAPPSPESPTSYSHSILPQVRQSQPRSSQPHHNTLPSISQWMPNTPPNFTAPIISLSSNLVTPRHTTTSSFHPYRREYKTIALDLLEKHNTAILEARRQVVHHTQQEPVHRVHQQKALQDPLSQQQLFSNLHQAVKGTELQKFLNNLRQYYRDEYDKELQQKQMEEEDEMDTDDDYQPNLSSSTSSVGPCQKKSSTKKKNAKSLDKPRWTSKEKSKLFEAVVRYKALDIMSSFDWTIIGYEIGRVDKACKDQWRRGILKMFREYVQNN